MVSASGIGPRSEPPGIWMTTVNIRFDCVLMCLFSGTCTSSVLALEDPFLLRYVPPVNVNDSMVVRNNKSPEI